jgi:hypothetical protein
MHTILETEALMIEVRAEVAAKNFTHALEILNSGLNGLAWFEVALQKLRCYVALGDAASATLVAQQIIAVPVKRFSIKSVSNPMASFSGVLVNYMHFVSSNILDESMEPFKNFLREAGPFDTDSVAFHTFETYDAVWKNQKDYLSENPTGEFFQLLLEKLQPAKLALLPPNEETLKVALVNMARYASNFQSDAIKEQVAELIKDLLPA